MGKKAWGIGLVSSLLLLGQASLTAAEDVVISEFKAANDGTDDWIELWNRGTTTVDLQGWGIGDENHFWEINVANPPLNLAPGQFLIVYARDPASQTPSALATGFQLGPEHDLVRLWKPIPNPPNEPTYIIVSEIIWNFPQESGRTYGLDEDGKEAYLDPTQGMTNRTRPSFSTAHKLFETPFNLVMKAVKPGATLKYTTDGSDPRTSPTAGPTPPNTTATISIDKTTVVRAVWQYNSTYSVINAQTYIYLPRMKFQPDDFSPQESLLPYAWPEAPVPDNFLPARFKPFPVIEESQYNLYGFDPGLVEGAENEAALKDALKALPSVSVTVPVDLLFGVNAQYTVDCSKGLYVNLQIYPPTFCDGERAASVELIYPDGSQGFSIDCGLQMRGQGSRYHYTTPKHSMELHFRGEEYDFPRLTHKLFPDSPVKSFNALVLRATSTDAWAVGMRFRNFPGHPSRYTRQEASLMRDQWMRDSHGSMGHPYIHGRFVHLYLNGLYWGIYNLIERPDEEFGQSYLGGDEDSHVITALPGCESSGWWTPSTGPDFSAAWWWQWTVNPMFSDPWNPDENWTDDHYWTLQGRDINPPHDPNPFPDPRIDMQNYIDYMILHIFASADDWPYNNWFAIRRADEDFFQNLNNAFKFIVWDQEMAINSLERQFFGGCDLDTTFERVHEGVAYFYNKLRLGSPAFKAAFKERVKALMGPTGLLSPAVNHERWLTRARQLDKAIIAESARWGNSRKLTDDIYFTDTRYSYPGETLFNGEPFPYKRSHWHKATDWMFYEFWYKNHTRICNRFKQTDVDLLPDPFIIEYPTNKTTTVGSSVTLYAQAWSATPAQLQYQWRFNGSDITGAQSAQLTLNNVSESNAGQYSIRVTKGSDVITSDPATLTVTPSDFVWVDDTTPAGATLGTQGGDTWTTAWVDTSTFPSFSGTKSIASTAQSGMHQLFFYNASTPILVNAGDVFYAYVYLNPANPPKAIMLQWQAIDATQWEHRAYWGTNVLTQFGNRTYMGELPSIGRWVRLEVPASTVGMVGRYITGMAFTLHGGQANWDKAGKRSGGDLLWIEDTLPPPPNDLVYGDGGDNWVNWVTYNPKPFSGDKAIQSGTTNTMHQLAFVGTREAWHINAGDLMVAYVYLDPANPPTAIMLQWYANDATQWEHRAYWGADNFSNFGVRTKLAALPAAGEWVRLEAPASSVELAGRTITGAAMTLYGGKATWDHVGKVAAAGSIIMDEAFGGVGVPVGASTSTAGGDSWSNWSGPAYTGIHSLLSANVSGFHEVRYWNAADKIKLHSNDIVYAYVKIDAASPPDTVTLEWHNDQGAWPFAIWTSAWTPDNPFWRGPIPTAGQWTRLELAVNTYPWLSGRTIDGMALKLNNGQARWDRIGVHSGETVWFDDAPPLGATTWAEGNDSWSNTGAYAPVPFSGCLYFKSGIGSGPHGLFFNNAPNPIRILPHDRLFAYVYVDPANPPRQIMLEFNSGDAGRVYWGENLLEPGNSTYIGPLPPTGRWVRLECPANLGGFDLDIYGIGFRLYDGRVYWDRAGRTKQLY